MYLFLPLLAAMAFAVGSLLFKRAFREGAKVAHAVVVNNVVLAVVFLPLMWLEPGPVDWSRWSLPVLGAIPFALGHLLNVLALRVGDVSLATPLLGAKVVLVAALARVLFGWPITPAQWAAAVLTTLGVVVMGVSDLRPGRRTGLTVVLSLGCAASFALTDVLIQLWAGRIGVFHFLPLQFATLAAFSILMLPLLGSQPLRAPGPAWRWTMLAVALSGVQAILITGSIAVWKDAAGVNVVYATRGLWSIALVWLVGSWFGNEERESTGRRGMGLRLAGALLILLAVMLAVGEARSA